MRFRLWSARRPAPPRQGGGDAPVPAETCHLRVLLVQDAEMGVSTASGLVDDGFDVVHERTGEGGYFRASTEKFAVVLLASTLPGRAGAEVLTTLRAQRVTTPVLMLLPGAGVDDRVAALDAGADDCAALPIASLELYARIRALARRGAVEPVRLSVGDIELDLVARTARRAGRPLQLTIREFQLLEYLVHHHGEVVTRQRLCRDVWQGRARLPLDNALDVHIARLRKKVEGDGPVRLIHTVRGVGFAFGEEAAVRTRRSS